MKSKFNIAFNEELTKESEVKDKLRPFKIVSLNRKGKYTWRVVIKSNKDAEDIAVILRKRGSIREVEVL